MTEEVKTAEQAVVKETKRKRNRANKQQDEIVTLNSGIRVKFHPVGANAIREVQANIPDAIPPTFKNPNVGQPGEPAELPNPHHPEYVAQMKQVENERTKAGMDTLLMMGMELIDPMPEDETWLDKIHFLRLISKDELQEAKEEAILKELYYKKYIVADAEVLSNLGELAGVTAEMVAQARAKFRGDEAGVAN